MVLMEEPREAVVLSWRGWRAALAVVVPPRATKKGLRRRMVALLDIWGRCGSGDRLDESPVVVLLRFIGMVFHL